MPAVAQFGDAIGGWLLAEFEVEHHHVRVASWTSQDSVDGTGYRDDRCSVIWISVDPGTHAFGNDVERLQERDRYRLTIRGSPRTDRGAP